MTNNVLGFNLDATGLPERELNWPKTPASLLSPTKVIDDSDNADSKFGFNS